MNQHLQSLTKLIQQSEPLSADDKTNAMQALMQAEEELEQKNRELEIETALEKVRARTMAMQKSDELRETSLVLFQQLKDLGEPAEQLTIGIVKEEENIVEVSATLQGIKLLQSFRHDIDEPFVMKKMFKTWKSGQKTLVIEQEWEELQSYNQYRNKLVGSEMFPVKLKPGDRRLVYIAFFSKGTLALSSSEARPKETLQLLERFASVLDLTYARFNDLQKAEAQAREANIEAALERVRSKALAMHKSDDLNAAVAIVFEELDKLNLGMLRCGIGILNKEKRSADVWTTTVAEQGTIVQVSGDESMDIHPLLKGAFDAWVEQGDTSYVLKGDDMSEYYRAVMKTNFHLPESQVMVEHDDELRHYYYAIAFQSGMLFAFRDSGFPEEAKTVMKRFAGVFNLTYKRFLDIQNAEAQARESETQKRLIEDKHREINENISYALRIQSAILPSHKLVKDFLSDSFVLYMPKDIVAGDFYWMTRVKDMLLFAVCDCTGHGVSGAMVSVICHNALNRAVREYSLTQPSLILDKVVELVEENFTQSEDKIQDGMDTSLCAYYPKEQKLEWAGANNPLWMVRNNELIEYKPDKQPIGKYENRKPFTNHEIQLRKGDSIYLFSDGYQDQFGGERGKKLTKNGFRNTLLSVSNKDMDAQCHLLHDHHLQWKGKEEQVDDICILGLKI